MADNLFASFDISSQGMSVQRMRLSATANNIANANTTTGPDGEPFQREVVVVRSIPQATFGNELTQQIQLSQSSLNHGENIYPSSGVQDNTVLQAVVAKDSSLPRLVFDPNHPDANEEGYVKYPNINMVTEMVEMISAQRAFQANTQVVQSAKSIARDALDI